MAAPIGDFYQSLIEEIKSGATADRVKSVVRERLMTDPDIVQLKKLELAVAELKKSKQNDPQLVRLNAVAHEVFQLIHLDYPSKMVALYNQDRDRFLALLSQIDDPKIRYEIARRCLAGPVDITRKKSIQMEETPPTFLQDIEHFKIDSEEARASLASLILDQKRMRDVGLDDYDSLIQVFNLTTEKERSRLLAFFVNKCDHETLIHIIKNISSFNIEQESNRVAIASACVYRSPKLAIKWIDSFQLTHPYLLSVYEVIGCLSIDLLNANRELLKITDDEFELIVISNYEIYSEPLIDFVANNYLSFSPQNQALLIPLLVKNHPEKIFELIKRYPLDQSLLILIGKEMSQSKAALLLVEKFDCLGITDETARFEILKQLSANFLSVLLSHPERFQIKNPDFLFQLYEIIGRKAPHWLINTASNLPAEADRLFIAKAIASSNPHSFFPFLSYFHLSRESCVELLSIYAYNLADDLSSLFELLHLDHETVVSIIKSNPLPSPSYFDYLVYTYQTSENLLSLEVIEEIIFRCAERDSTNTLELLHYFNGVLNKKALVTIATLCVKNILPVDQRLEHDDLINDICKKAKSYPDVSLILDLFRRFFVGATARRFDRYKMLIGEPGQPPTIHLLLPMLQIAIWAEAIEENAQSDQALSQLRNQLSVRKLRLEFRNTGSTLQKLWLSTLEKLDREPILEVKKSYQNMLTLMIQITQRLNPKNSAEDLIDRLASLQGIMNTRSDDQQAQNEITQLLENLPLELAKPETTITRYLQQRFEERLKQDPYLDLEGIEDLSIKYASTFGMTRIPGALQIYEGSLPKQGDPVVRASFNLFVRAVLNGTFSSTRYKTDSPHKQYLATHYPEAWQQWQRANQMLTIEVKATSPRPIDFRDFALVKFRQGHFKNHLTQLASYLQTRAVPKPLDPIDGALIELCQNQPLDQETFLIKLNEIEAGMSALKELPFATDLKALKTKLLQPPLVDTYQITNTDDWELLFYSGTDVGSCQSLDRSGFNRGLLGTLLDGSCRMLAIIHPISGKIVARSIIRLLIDEETDQPVIFQEPIYPQPCRENLVSAINQFTKTVAEQLKLPLFIEDRSIINDEDCRPLIHKGHNCYLYTDAGGGLAKNFIISQVKVVK